VGALVAPSLERWAAIAPVFDRALDLAPERRATYLAEACSGDPALLSAVERLLRAGDASEGFLAEPAAAYAAALVATVAEHQSPALGEWLGPYLIEGVLGRGGMATVYMAHDPRLGRRVALKVLRPEISGALGGGRFAREIAIAARLSHPSILPLYDSGTLELTGAPPLLYYTMPHVPGRSLRDRLREQPPLPVTEAIGIARQVAAALDYAHREGVVHRDIKPENILLAEGGARVADFGIARALDAAGGERLTETGLALGTPAYMSPEQGAGSTRLDGRADIYALGCVLYEMLAGQPPFTGPTAQAVLARHAMDPVPSLRTVRPEVGAGLSRAVRRALAKVPADRYPTAGAFSEALAAPEAGWSGAADAVGPATGRRPLRAALLAAVGLGVVVLAVALALGTRGRQAQPASIDPAVVAIAPFRVASADPALGYLREGLVDLLAAKLGGTLALRTVDSRTLLNTWHRAGGSSGELSERQALEAAGRLGAGQLIEGEVVGSGRRVTISAAVIRVAGTQARVQVSVEGSADSVTSLVDELAARLLARAAGESEERLPALDATPPAALRAYLEGEALLRQNNTAYAHTKFSEALAADSTFALAALGASRTILEGSTVDRQGREVQLAWRLRDRLTPNDRALLEVILGPKYPEVSRPREFGEAAARFTQLDPLNADAWNYYGIFNCLIVGDPDIDARCRTAYHRAAALDSTNGLTLYNTTLWGADLGDTAGARRMLRLYMRLDSISPASLMLQWLTATKLGDTAAARHAALSDSLVSAGADWDLGSVWQMLVYYVNEGRGLSDAELVVRRSQAIAATGGQRAQLEHARYRLAVIRGQADGLPQPSWFSEEMSNYWRVANALFADADPAPAVAAAAALERQVGSPVTGGCCLWRFTAAQWALQEGRLATVRRALTDMERYPRSPEGRANPGSGEERLWPLIVRAQLAAREGSPVAAERLRKLDSVLVNQGADWENGPLYGNLISARLHEARQEYKEALAALRRRDATFFWPIVVTYHREEGRIAAEAGDTAGAIRAYERYLRIRDHVEPRLRPEVERVRAELAALRRSP
jgi:eukaryotic-like serine/threonine-protein kinase